jgi:hypothetical protein
LTTTSVAKPSCRFLNYCHGTTSTNGTNPNRTHLYSIPTISSTATCLGLPDPEDSSTTFLRYVGIEQPTQFDIPENLTHHNCCENHTAL